MQDQVKVPVQLVQEIAKFLAPHPWEQVNVMLRGLENCVIAFNAELARAAASANEAPPAKAEAPGK